MSFKPAAHNALASSMNIVWIHKLDPPPGSNEHQGQRYVVLGRGRIATNHAFTDLHRIKEASKSAMFMRPENG